MIFAGEGSVTGGGFASGGVVADFEGVMGGSSDCGVEVERVGGGGTRVVGGVRG